MIQTPVLMRPVSGALALTCCLPTLFQNLNLTQRLKGQTALNIGFESFDLVNLVLVYGCMDVWVLDALSTSEVAQERGTIHTVDEQRAS